MVTWILVSNAANTKSRYDDKVYISTYVDVHISIIVNMHVCGM